MQAKRHGGPLRAGRRIGEDAKALRKSFDVVEQQGRAFGRSRRHFGDAAKLEPRVGAFDAAQCAEPLNGRDELAQVAIGHVSYSESVARMERYRTTASEN